MKINVAILAVVTGGAMAALAGCGADAGEGASETTNVQSVAQAIKDPVKAGAHAFDHKMPTGNGRACATCHVEADAFTLTPAHVEARYQALPRDSSGRIHFESDPLFNSIDADDYDHDFTRLRQGLARVTIDLPANVTIDELPGARKVDLFRAVPTIRNVAFTGPYLSDRRAVTLQDQALGASHQHMQVRKAPDALSLDNIAAYETDQFSSDGVRFVASEIAAGRNPPQADKANLTAEEQQGKDAFTFRCTQCHGGNTLNNGPVARFVSRTLGVSVSRLNRPNLPVLTYRFSMPSGPDVVLKSPDPGHSLQSGDPNLASEFETFDVPTLYGIKDTAPYFHDNGAANLEAVMQHYQQDFAFAKMIGVPDPAVQTPFTDEEMRLIVLYMKTL